MIRSRSNSSPLKLSESNVGVAHPPRARFRRDDDGGLSSQPGRTAGRGHLSRPRSPRDSTRRAYCGDRRAKLSPIIRNRRGTAGARARPTPVTNPAEAGGLSIDQVRGLKLKWAFGFDGDVTAFAQPTVIDGQVFVGSAGGVIHALRAGTGCLQWTFQANGPVRSSILAVPHWHEALVVVRRSDGVVLLGGSGERNTAVEEEDRRARCRASDGQRSRVRRKRLRPVASWEETRSLDPTYSCCTFRGSIVALRIRDGEQVWKA